MNCRLCIGNRALKWSLALAAVLFRSLTALAQVRDLPWAPESPEWSTPGPHLRYIETDVEAEDNRYRSANGGTQQDSTRLYISPRLGIGWNSYIYHPYLLSFSILAEPGYVWQGRTLEGQSNHSDEFIVDGTATFNILQMKPYSTVFSLNRSHEEIRYDFFNTAIVDSEGWGVTTGYREGPVPVIASFQQSHDEATDFNQVAKTDQATLNFDARNDRHKDNFTDLNYIFGQFDRDTIINGSSFKSDNTYQHISLADVEHFEHSVLKSTIRYNDRESETVSSSDFNAALNYNVDHTEHLRGYYNYSLSRFADAPFDSLQNYLVAGLQHQLFDSLTTTLEGHGSTLNSGSGASTLDSISGGTTFSLDYSKHLSEWARLSLGNNLSYNYTDQQSSGGMQTIANESYTVPVNGLIRLTQPRVTSVTVITDINGIPLVEGQDFSLIENVDPWLIQIFSTGPNHVQPGSKILVTYNVESNPSGSYTTLANQSYIRLSFWHDLLAVYGRYSFTDNHTEVPGFVLQDDEIVEAGTEVNWRHVKLLARYTDEHSTLYNFKSYDLAESYSRDIFSQSTVGIDLNQEWTYNTFHDPESERQSENMTFFGYMLHYDWRPTSTFSWTVELGYRQQRGFDLDQDFLIARTYLNWMMGKLQAHFGYEHGYQNIRGETTDRDYVFLRVRRSF
jgi:hypothetical protein